MQIICNFMSKPEDIVEAVQSYVHGKSARVIACCQMYFPHCGAEYSFLKHQKYKPFFFTCLCRYPLQYCIHAVLRDYIYFSGLFFFF